MRAEQTDFFSNPVLKLSKRHAHTSSFGGSSLKSHPKTARPFSTKHLMHVVLKSERAKGPRSFLRIERELIALAKTLGIALNVQIKDIVVMTNHVHLSIKVSHRRAFHAYLRALGGLIVRKLLKTEKGNPTSVKNFFTGRPFSRIVAAGRKSFAALARYFALNRLEKRGFRKVKADCMDTSCRNINICEFGLIYGHH